jgi:hypothetical protein
MKKLISGVNKYNLFAFSVLANPGLGEKLFRNRHPSTIKKEQ